MNPLVTIVRAISRHAVLTLRLNFRSPQAIAYGYLMPVLFLFAFAGIFRAENPPLLAQMGQLLTITLLGGACFGLPTALVAERERGVWRRYRLLPVPPAVFLLGTVLARIAILSGGVALQLALAHLVFGTPWPQHPAVLLAALAAAMFALLGLGLVVAALAEGVPAVQALGQCLFLPMIVLGGVGVPLAVLPDWAQRFAGFMPGRYAVTALQAGFGDHPGALGLGFALVALVVIGAAATVVGILLFRWDNSRRLGRHAWAGLGAALAAWLIVGGVAAATGRLRPVLPPGYGWQEITAAQIATITYENLPADGDLVTRLAPPLARPYASARLESIEARLPTWAPARGDNAGEAIRHLVALATLADLGQDPQEGEIARLVFDHLRATYSDEELRRALAWIILRPDDGTVVTSASAFGLRREIDESAVRNRAPLYAGKFLGRLTGAIAAP